MGHYSDCKTTSLEEFDELLGALGEPKRAEYICEILKYPEGSW